MEYHITVRQQPTIYTGVQAVLHIHSVLTYCVLILESSDSLWHCDHILPPSVSHVQPPPLLLLLQDKIAHKSISDSHIINSQHWIGHKYLWEEGSVYRVALRAGWVKLLLVFLNALLELFPLCLLLVRTLSTPSTLFFFTFMPGPSLGCILGGPLPDSVVTAAGVLLLIVSFTLHSYLLHLPPLLTPCTRRLGCVCVHVHVYVCMCVERRV